MFYDGKRNVLTYTNKPEYQYLDDDTANDILNKLKNGYRMKPNVDNTINLIPPDENEIAKQKAQARMAELKSYLSATDYQAIKFAEGELSAEDYADMKVQRAEWRAEINQLEEKINNLRENNNE